MELHDKVMQVISSRTSMFTKSEWEWIIAMSIYEEEKETVKGLLGKDEFFNYIRNREKEIKEKISLQIQPILEELKKEGKISKIKTRGRVFWACKNICE